MTAPTESKVYGATIGGGAGSIVTAFVLWLLGITFWGVSADAASAAEAISAVPLPVTGLLTGIITLGGVYGGGWLAKHTPRPDLDYQPKRVLVEDEPAAVVEEIPATPTFEDEDEDGEVAAV